MRAFGKNIYWRFRDEERGISGLEERRVFGEKFCFDFQTLIFLFKILTFHGNFWKKARNEVKFMISSIAIFLYFLYTRRTYE